MLNVKQIAFLDNLDIQDETVIKPLKITFIITCWPVLPNELDKQVQFQLDNRVHFGEDGHHSRSEEKGLMN